MSQSTLPLPEGLTPGDGHPMPPGEHTNGLHADPKFALGNTAVGIEAPGGTEHYACLFRTQHAEDADFEDGMLTSSYEKAFDLACSYAAQSQQRLAYVIEAPKNNFGYVIQWLPGGIHPCLAVPITQRKEMYETYIKPSLWT
ncbi:MAG: hypothetical protein LDL41_02230 [Coleofasciculus sp. S288]|nr:hypothetical protein [Coleofasciculus sp. S288]